MYSRYQIKLFDKMVFYFSIVDSLFLPYFWGIAIPYSMPIVFLWGILRFSRLTNMKMFKISILLVVLVIVSTVIGSLINDNDISNNISRALVLIKGIFLIFLYLYIKKNSGDKYLDIIGKFLFAFILVVFIIFCLYMISADLYNEFRDFYNPRSMSYSVDIYSNTYRYGYLWSDPNNIGYMVNGVMLFLFCMKKISLIKKILIFLCVTMITIGSMSTGGVIAECISILFLVYYNFNLKKIKFNRKVTKKTFYGIVVVLLAVAIGGMQMDKVLSSQIFEGMILRQEMKIEEGDGRSEIYDYVISNVDWWQYVIWGMGGRTVINGHFRSPHNGILYLIIAYGMLSAIIFLFILLKKEKVITWQIWSWRVPVFLGILLNIMITEDKIMSIISLMIAFDGGLVSKNIDRIKDGR